MLLHSSDSDFFKLASACPCLVDFRLPFSTRSSYCILDTVLFLRVDLDVAVSIFDRIRTARANAGAYDRLGGTVWLYIQSDALPPSMFHRVRDSAQLSHVRFREVLYQ